MGRSGRTLRIEVDANRGRVSLDGDAASIADMQSAITAARSVTGVKAVENDMRLSTRAYGYGYGDPYNGYGYAMRRPYEDPYCGNELAAVAHVCLWPNSLLVAFR